MREALGPQLDGLPPAIDFVAKQDGPQVLLTSIRKVLGLVSRFYQGLNDLSKQIEDDYEDARQQARISFWASFVISLIGVVIIFISLSIAIVGNLEIGLVSSIAGVIAEVIGLLFFKRADTANRRMDEYHRELLETKRFDNLLAASDALLTARRKEKSKVKIIEAAAKYWLDRNDNRAEKAVEEVENKRKKDNAK